MCKSFKKIFIIAIDSQMAISSELPILPSSSSSSTRSIEKEVDVIGQYRTDSQKEICSKLPMLPSSTSSSTLSFEKEADVVGEVRSCKRKRRNQYDIMLEESCRYLASVDKLSKRKTDKK